MYLVSIEFNKMLYLQIYVRTIVLVFVVFYNNVSVVVPSGLPQMYIDLGNLQN